MSTLLAEKRAVPPMGGLAIMAAELAAKRFPGNVVGYRRFGGMTTVGDHFKPSPRETCAYHETIPGAPPITSSEYYRIIDRVARGEKP